jgi:serine/threonine kinase 16
MAQNEVNYLRKFDGSDGIIRLYDSLVEERQQVTWMLLELGENGTLESLLKSKPDLPLQEVIRILVSVCQGVQTMHSAAPPIAHRDLKPGNVLLMKDMRAVIMDLGSASLARVNPKSRKEALALQEWCEETCSILYRAPELFEIQPDAEIDEQTDIWSLGCLLYYCLYRASPFEEAFATGSVKLAVMSANNIIYPAQPSVPPSLAELLRRMLSTNPKERPNIAQVRSSLSSVSA